MTDEEKKAWRLLLKTVDRNARAGDAYQDDSYPARNCDCCGTPYRGPAVYCSLECAQKDA